jgi:hypothetical protein
MNKDKKTEDRPLAYPFPTEADKQQQNQPEYIDQEPGKFDKTISDIPGQPIRQDGEESRTEQ